MQRCFYDPANPDAWTTRPERAGRYDHIPILQVSAPVREDLTGPRTPKHPERFVGANTSFAWIYPEGVEVNGGVAGADTDGKASLRE